MNRRKFIGMLAAAPVVARVAPLLPAPTTVSYRYHFTSVIVNARYADFITVSDLATGAAIDPVVADCAKELSYRAGLAVDA